MTVPFICSRIKHTHAKKKYQGVKEFHMLARIGSL